MLQRQDVAAAAAAAATLTAAATQQRTPSSPSTAAAAPSPAAVVAACPQCARQKRSAAPCVRRPCREAQATCRKLVSRAATIVFAALRSMQLMGHQIFDKSAAAGHSLKLGFLLCCINRSMGIKPRTTQQCTPGTANTKHAAAGRVAGQVLLRKKNKGKTFGWSWVWMKKRLSTTKHAQAESPVSVQVCARECAGVLSATACLMRRLVKSPPWIRTAAPMTYPPAACPCYLHGRAWANMGMAVVAHTAPCYV